VYTHFCSPPWFLVNSSLRIKCLVSIQSVVEGLGGGSCSHILLELLDVGMGVGQSLLELQELLLLALADSEVLLGLLTLLESITAVRERRVSQTKRNVLQRQQSYDGRDRETYPWPPVGRIAPVSPAPMAREVVANVRAAGRAALMID